LSLYKKGKKKKRRKRKREREEERRAPEANAAHFDATLNRGKKIVFILFFPLFSENSEIIPDSIRIEPKFTAKIAASGNEACMQKLCGLTPCMTYCKHPYVVW